MATSLKIDDMLKGRVQHLASQRRRSPHWIMLEAIQQYVEREEARESFKQEALASWAAFKETGRHLTGQEVRTWLNTWGTDDERAVLPLLSLAAAKSDGHEPPLGRSIRQTQAASQEAAVKSAATWRERT